MATETETSLISKLETSDYSQIHHHFSTYLHPFTNLTTTNNHPKLTKKSKPQTKNELTLIRSLAKKYLSFLNRALSLLPKCLSETKSHDPVPELFDTYRLCLNCLDCISSQLSCKPYSIYIQRVRMVHCFETCGLYKDAEDEAFSILEGLRCSDDLGGLGSKLGKTNGQYVPELGKESVDGELGLLVVEIVVTLVKCAGMNESKDGATYRRVLTLLDEVRPWFRVLDANAYEKLHRMLVTYLNKCTLFLVDEPMRFEADLTCAFCLATLTECAQSSMKEQMYKFARRICSSVLSKEENRSSLIGDILNCVLDSIAHQCKVEMENTVKEFLEIVSYCANKCRTASARLCASIVTHLNKIAGDFHKVLAPLDLILRIYAIGLYFTNSNVLSRDGDSSTLESAKDIFDSSFFRDHEERLQSLAAVLGFLRNIFPIGGQENNVPLYVEHGVSVDRSCSNTECDYKSIMASQRNQMGYPLFYLNALKFLCQPLAELVNLAKKQILVEEEAVPIPSILCIIQDAFLLLGDVFLVCQSRAYERERNGFDESDRLVLSGAVAAYTLSFRTKVNVKKSVKFIKHVISNGWSHLQGLKYLFVSLYNIGVIFYRHNQVKEASKALQLCSRASWACVLLLCQMFVEKSKGLHGDLSEAAIVDFVTDACTKGAFLLDVLHQCACHKVKIIIVDSLEKWAVAGNLFKSLPSPISLVKQWVKIECILSKDADEEYLAPTLYCLLSSSAKVSKRTVGILLDQELLAYEGMSAKYTKFCQKMQLRIMDILLEDVYVTKDNCLRKSKILIKKGSALRAHGIEGLKDCIQCFTEAISTVEDTYGDVCSRGILGCHHLAVAYCLRALSTQEADPNSKQVFHDIHAALGAWLSIRIPDHCAADDQCNMVSDMTILLLYRIVDLLSLKGHTEFHHDIYKLLIRLFKWKNAPMEKCLAMLWQYRRLSHALCVSPVNEAFILNLSEHCGELSKSMNYWISCLRGSQPLVVGFQQNFSFLFMVSTQGSCCHKSSFQSQITIDEVKKAALELISSVHVPSHSVFLAGYLFHDLCERLMSNGRPIEALSYAKEAHLLRGKLLQEKFTYSIEHQKEDQNGGGKFRDNQKHDLTNFQILNSVATEVWSYETMTWDLEGCSLTPWNVLQCYLESTLQVGFVHEMVGNCAEAEILLLWGKNISTSQGLPLFIVAFSSVLGKLYRKKQLWDLAAAELQNAKKIMMHNSTYISCLKCRLILEVAIDQQLGDLSRAQYDNCSSSIKKLYDAENLYKSALDKLDLSEWKNSISDPKETSADSMMVRNTFVNDVEHGVCNTLASCATDNSDVRKCISKGDRQEAKVEAKRTRKPKKAAKQLPREQILITEHNLRITRSRSRFSQNKSVSHLGELQNGLAEYSNGNHVPLCVDTLSKKMSLLEVKKSAVESGYEVKCTCNKMKCWQCLPVEVMASGSVNNYLHLKWEFIRRRLSLRLLTGIGKCLGVRGEIHATHEVFLRCVAILAGRNPFSHKHSSVLVSYFLDVIGKEIPGDVFAVERAVVLYNICWFSLKRYHLKETRTICCDLSEIQIPKLVSWLLLAFVLSREVPVLFQKVSRLLAAVCLLSASSESFLFPLSSCKALSESHWASFFHQASIGTHLNHQLLSTFAGKYNAHNLMDVKGSSATGSTCTGTETYSILRLAPESLHDLDDFVSNFFGGLPRATVVCLSLLGGDFASLLNDLLFYPSSVRSWMLLSRLNSKSQPLVVLLPVNSVLEASDDDSTNSSSGNLFEDKDLGNQWHCPWGSTVVDDLAPGFRSILRENYLSSSIFPQEDTKRTRSLWWMRRKKLDQCLGKLLRDLEDLWFGPCKYLLLGEWTDCRRLGSIQKKLVRDLSRKCKLDVNESLLRVILGGARYVDDKEECIRQLSLCKSCYIGRVGYGDEKRFTTLSDLHGGVENLSVTAFQLLLEAVNELEQEECLQREPIILVLDSEVQMLPWENIPILRNQEAYRMPSVGCITEALARSLQCEEQVGDTTAAFPFIDPLDAFYLLNPSGDLSSTQIEFENWFKDQKLEGMAGKAPTIKELVVALKSHDLFIYFGHGSGAQYIPGHEIQKLDSCAATLLMGCSSGSLSLNGSYTPQGIPLSYLLAGSPVIVANLWEVTDKDIDRFGKAMLEAWLRERSNPFAGYDHRPKIGSFICQAREACTLPFLIGAAPICYGIPTGIRKKKDLYP